MDVKSSIVILYLTGNRNQYEQESRRCKCVEDIYFTDTHII